MKDGGYMRGGGRGGGGGGGGESIECEVERCPNASIRLANFSNERQGSRALLQRSWCVHRHCRLSTFNLGLAFMLVL